MQSIRAKLKERAIEEHLAGNPYKIIDFFKPEEGICKLGLVAPELVRCSTPNRQLTFLYLCQTSTAKSVENIKKGFQESEFRKLKLLTFKEKVKDCIYLPRSTWTEGRNELIEWAKQQPEFDYYILMDDDIQFELGNYERIEYEISELSPYYYCPEYVGYYNESVVKEFLSPQLQYKDICYNKTVWSDAICSCFHKKLFFDDFILPYEARYDSITWWISQAILFNKVAYKYPNNSIVSRTVKILNTNHGEYPRNLDIFTSLNNYFGQIPRFNIKLLPLKNENCVIITTINPPNKQIEFYSKLNNYDLIIVADKKTDISKYYSTNCVLLDLPAQKNLAPELYELVPFNSYTRKMFGYVYAIASKYKMIYETDDDNMFKTRDLTYPFSNKQALVSDSGFVNLYKNYTDKHIWPRGIPPNHESIRKTCSIQKTEPVPISIYQGLVDKDPDVDAIYRLEHSNGDVFFDKLYDTNLLLNKFSVCPFNSQNTFWVDRSVMYSMYLPITVTFRYTDILRSFVALFELWKNEKTIAFTPPTAIQERNAHDLQKDKLSETPMYETAEQVCDLLKEAFDKDIVGVYEVLLENNIVQKEELTCLKVWLETITPLL